jgi:hypothetical protein
MTWSEYDSLYSIPKTSPSRKMTARAIISMARSGLRSLSHPRAGELSPFATFKQIGWSSTFTLVPAYPTRSRLEARTCGTQFPVPVAAHHRRAHTATITRN